MDLKIAGKRALVTGASSGIGRDIAKALAAEGVVVAVNGRNAERTRQVIDEIAADGGEALAAIGDLVRDDDVEAIADIVGKELGGIDILVNNAGGSEGDATRNWRDIAIEEYVQAYETNVLGGLRLIHRFAPAMADRGWGRIINVSSAVARQAMGVLHHYGTAKIALENLSLNLSMDLARSGVTVNTIVPGMILTQSAHGFLDLLRETYQWPDDPEEIQRRYTAEVAPQPVPRFGMPEEIAAAVAFLASPLSNYTTGAVLRVDGGMTRGL